MTSPDRLQQIQQLFHDSLGHAGEERTRYLQQACGADTQLRNEVEALLAAHEEDKSFLARPAFEVAALAPAEDATLLQSAPPPPPTKTISHYEVLSLLGKGGMGEVYLAADQSLGRKAALKILPARYTTDADLVHRFEREAKAASALNHPNIMTVYEIGKTDGSHFIATEFIEGETLRQRIARGDLPLTEAVDIALQIAAALTAAHEAGIIHRDIKPDNIMLRPDGYVKVLDFGLAKLTERASSPDDSTTQTGMIMGTPNYMAPEQARGLKVDARADIWSFGVVLYELVSGVRPFSGNTQADLIAAILEHEPHPVPPNLPPELQQLITQALAKDLAQRPATVREMGQVLKTLRHKLELPGEAVAAAPEPENSEAPTLRIPSPLPTTVPAPEMPVVSKPTRLPALMASLVVLVGLGFGSWLWLRPKTNLPPAPPPPPVAPAPQREMTWWLMVQRMENGKLASKAFPSAGQEWFPPGSVYKFNMTSPQAGHLYLLNEGPTKGGKISLNLLYPLATNNNFNATVAANQSVQTVNFRFDEHEGEEKFWIVWAAHSLAEIEAVKTKTVDYEIQDATQSAAILSLLKQHATQSIIKMDEDQERTHVKGNDVIVQLVKLRHR